MTSISCFSTPTSIRIPDTHGNLGMPWDGKMSHPTELDIAGFFEVHSQISPEWAPQDGDKKEKIFYLMCQQKED